MKSLFHMAPKRRQSPDAEIVLANLPLYHEDSYPGFTTHPISPGGIGRCEYCGGYPGASTSCVNCGAPSGRDVPPPYTAGDAMKWLAKLYENLDTGYLEHLQQNPSLSFTEYYRNLR